MALVRRLTSAIVQLCNNRLPPLAVVRVSLAIATACRAERDHARAEPRDASAAALGEEVAASADAKIAEQATIAPNSQAAAARLAKARGRRIAGGGQSDDDDDQRRSCQPAKRETPSPLTRPPGVENCL
jgi:hypothetical protein